MEKQKQPYVTCTKIRINWREQLQILQETIHFQTDCSQVDSHAGCLLKHQHRPNKDQHMITDRDANRQQYQPQVISPIETYTLPQKSVSWVGARSPSLWI